MKIHISIGIIAALIAVGSSCADDTIELRGQVVDDNTGVGISGRKVLVQALETVENRQIPVHLGSFSTDNAGNFIYALEKDPRHYLFNFSMVGDSDYAYREFQLGLAELYRYGKFLKFDQRRLTGLTIRIESRRHIAMDESVYVSWITDGTEGRFLYPYTVSNHGSAPAAQQLKWTGGNVRSEIHTRVFAGKTTVIHWEIFRYGKYRKISDTIMCARDVENQVTLTF